MDKDEVYIDYSDFDLNKLIIGDVVNNIANVQYNYGDDKYPILTNLYLQLPFCKAYGIKNNKIRTILPYDEDGDKCKQILDEIYKKCLEKTEISNFCKLYIEKSKDETYLNDKIDKTKILYADSNDQDMITGWPTLKTIDYSFLEKAKYGYIPLLKFGNIHTYEKLTILHHHLESMVLLYRIDINKNYRQQFTVEQLHSDDPNFSDRITSQIYNCSSHIHKDKLKIPLLKLDESNSTDNNIDT